MKLTFNGWAEQRSQQGTLAHTVRALIRSGVDLQEATALVRLCYTVEALMVTDGHCKQAAESIGLDRGTVSRILSAHGFDWRRVRDLARALAQDENREVA
jgi:DNA-binding NtrC family response regulator